MIADHVVTIVTCGNYSNRCGNYGNRCGKYGNRCGNYGNRCGDVMLNVVLLCISSMEGGELFTSIQARADNAFTERGKIIFSLFSQDSLYLLILFSI